MLSKFRNRFGAPGVLAVIALVFAMVGGAYAASDALNGKQKKEVKKIAQTEAKKFATAGPAGPAGPAGKDGTNGTNGANGANGKSAETGTATLGECPNGGATVQVGGEAATKKKICNGAEGSPWTTGGVLPPGKSLTGTWTVGRTGVATPTIVFSPVSFSLPLAAAGEENEATGEAENKIPVTIMTKASLPTAGCPGSVADPEAAPGNLCVYVVQSFETTFSEERNPENNLSLEGAGRSGALLGFTLASATASARGSWVLTAPTP